MPKQYTLNLVTGAPGSGKSVSAQLCATSQSRFVAFDMDSLLGSASALASKDIQFSPETWPSYNALWMDVIKTVLANGKAAVLFTPLAPSDLDPAPAWYCGVRWLLLDCSDEAIHQRLRARQWDEGRIREALLDAGELRAYGFETIVPTDQLGPNAVADAITSWQERSG